MSVPFDMGVFVSWNQIFGTRSSSADVVEAFSRVPRHLATAQLSSLCAQIQQGDSRSVYKFDDQARALLLNDELTKRIGALPSPPRRIAFHRQQLLLGLQVAQRACNDLDPRELSTTQRRSAFEALGEALIRVSDFMDRDLKVEDWRGFMPIFFPLYAASNAQGLLTALRRTRLMLQDSRWEQDQRLSSALDRFRESFGLTPTDYMSVVLGLVTKVRQRGGAADPSLRLGQVFSEARDRQGIRSVLEDLSTPIERLPAAVATVDEVLETKPEEPFRSRPLIALPGDRFWPVDLHFLTDRALSGVFWKLWAVSSDDERLDLFSAWGTLFESQMNLLLGEAFGRKYTPNPTDSQAREVTDAILVEQPDLIFFEFKASPLRNEAKLGYSFDLLAAEIGKKFVKNAQAGRALDRLLNDGVLSARFLRRAKARVYPIVVALDYSAGAPWVSKVADDIFQSSVPVAAHSRASIEPLTVITADDAEALAVLKAKGLKVKNVLRAYFSEDPDRANSFHNQLVGHARRMRVSLLGAYKEAFHSVFAAAAAYWESQGSGVDLFASI